MTRRTDNPEKPEAPDQDAREALSRLTDENELLRAALAEARARLGEAEEEGGRDALTALHDPRRFRGELERVPTQRSTPPSGSRAASPPIRSTSGTRW
jgi:hypothetical protein